MRGLTLGKWEILLGKQGITYLADSKPFRPTPNDYEAMMAAPELCNEVVKLYHAFNQDDEDSAAVSTAQLFGIVRKLGLLS